MIMNSNGSVPCQDFILQDEIVYTISFRNLNK